MSNRWNFIPCNEALAEKLFQGLENLPRPVVSLLVQRGCETVEDISKSIHCGLRSLCDPFELPDMSPAVDRVWRALRTGERVTVFGDYDADGICSTALLVRVLRLLGAEVSAFIPNRLADGYGLSLHSLATCIERCSPSLIITVDCGTSSFEAVEKAKELGVDVVVTDHHEPGSEVARAVAVVNPKVGEAGNPSSILAGVGVAFKLCHALIKVGRDANNASAASIDLKEYLDFVAVATVTDMVPLLGENRALVRAGFQTLENSTNAGWNALKKLAGVTGQIVAYHAGFALGPRINAAGRIGRPDAALELFLTDLPSTAEEKARFLDQANRERQTIEKTIVQEAVDEIEKTFNADTDFGIVIAREGWHIGVIGIVASRLVQRYERPVVVIGLENGAGRGSCRSIAGFSILDGLNACSGLLQKYGGHEMAAGLDIEEKHLAAFRKQFNAFASERLKGADLRSVVNIDQVLQLADVTSSLMDGLKRAGPFGQDNPEPVWAVLNAQVADSRVLKEKHLKLVLSDGDSRVDAIGFNMAEKLPAGAVDVAFNLQENTWKGRTTIQLNLKDIRPADFR